MPSLYWLWIRRLLILKFPFDRLCSLLRKKLHWQRVHLILQEAVEIETEFVCDSLPCALIGMNSTLMSQYIKFVADRLLVSLSLSLCWSTSGTRKTEYVYMFTKFCFSGGVRVPEEVQCWKPFWLDGVHILTVSIIALGTPMFTLIAKKSPYFFLVAKISLWFSFC